MAQQMHYYPNKKQNAANEKQAQHKKEEIMKTLKTLVTMTAGSASAAYAATGVQSQETGLLIYFFIGFFALIVVSQLVPAAILFVGMIKGVFSHNEKTSVNKS